MLARSLHTLRRAALPPKPFPRAAAGVPRRCGSRGLVRGPSAGTGTGRSAWVEHDGVVHTVAYPFGATAEDGVGDQTRMALASLDERLAQAGTVSSPRCCRLPANPSTPPKVLQSRTSATSCVAA